MKKITLLFAAVAVCFGLTLNTFAQKKSSVPPVYLNVTIEDFVTAEGEPIGIGSDKPNGGNGYYVHGLDGVTAEFNSNGYLNFKSGNRLVNAYYTSPLGDSPTGSTLPAKDTATNVQILTFVNDLYLQTMGIGEVRCQGFGVNVPLPNYRRTVGYRAGRGTITNTAWVMITHPDDRTWIMTPTSGGVCQPNSDDIARIRDEKLSGKPVPDIDYGRFLMPFRLILTRQ
jgi:hypothetical protein